MINNDIVNAYITPALGQAAAGPTPASSIRAVAKTLMHEVGTGTAIVYTPADESGKNYVPLSALLSDLGYTADPLQRGDVADSKRFYARTFWGPDSNNDRSLVGVVVLSNEISQQVTTEHQGHVLRLEVYTFFPMGNDVQANAMYKMAAGTIGPLALTDEIQQGLDSAYEGLKQRYQVLLDNVRTRKYLPLVRIGAREGNKSE